MTNCGGEKSGDAGATLPDRIGETDNSGEKQVKRSVVPEKPKSEVKPTVIRPGGQEQEGWDKAVDRSADAVRLKS